MAMIQCFLIAEPNWNLFVAAVTKASNRAVKLGMGSLTWEPAPEFDSLGDGSPVPMKAVALMGDVPETNEWRLVGRLEHLPDSQEALITGNVPEHLRHDGPVCDHCNTNRARNLTYVVRFGNGAAYKRVGKSCLGEFLQTDAPDRLAKYFDLLANVIETLDTFRHYDNTGSSHLVRYFSPSHVLSVAAVVVRTEGWTSVAEAERMGIQSTGSRVAARIDEEPHPTPDDDQTVDAVVSWLLSGDVEDAAANSPYLHNLKAMVVAGSVPGHKIGLMASSIQAWKRAQEKKREDTVSQFVGEVGKRCEFEVTLLRTTELYSAWGSKTLHSFIDREGNRLVWFATGYSPMRVGNTYHIAARVEAHQIYKDAFQTQLSRVTCLDMKLIDVAAKGDVKQLKKLLAKGLNVNVRNPDGRGPLHEAVLNNQEEATVILLDAKASLDAKDRQRNSPLHLGAANGHYSVVKLLLSSGATVEPDMLEVAPPECPGVRDLLTHQLSSH